MKAVRESGKNCTVARLASGFMKSVCFNETSLKHHFKCANSNVTYQLQNNGKPYATEVCLMDPYVYQVCGNEFAPGITTTDVFCGGYFCEHGDHNFVECEGEGCRAENRNCVSTSNKSIDATICDDKCDKRHCEDEGDCNGYRYGVFGYHSGAVYDYAPVSQVCNGFYDLHNDLDSINIKEYSDEMNCSITNSTAYLTCTHYKEKVKHLNLHIVPIFNYTRCSVFDLTNDEDFDDTYPYCLDYLDQTNCSDAERVGGYCEINGYMSSVSKYMVCYMHDRISKLPVKICDNNFENNCVYTSTFQNCRVHKHRLCDGIIDCPDTSDEVHDLCKIVSDELDFACTRMFQPKLGERGIPVSWIMDNETDCMNGEDENVTQWKFCPGKSKKLELPGKGCQNVYKCPGSDASYVEFDLLCDGIESCEKGGENRVCMTARDSPIINNAASINGTMRSVCNSSNNACEIREFRRPWGDVFGEEKIMLHVPNSKVKCSELFGEHFLFLSCMNLCEETNVECPLADSNRRLDYNSCLGQYPNRAYTLGNNSFLTFLDRPESGSYHQNYYQCNNRRCIEYKQVCNFIDDCGDMSDEINCTNHMVCQNTIDSPQRQFISLQQKCDGLYDCFDLSDECNEDCGREILETWSLKITCWIFGIMAMVFNFFTIVNGSFSLMDCETEQMMISKVLMTLIGTGDFLIGLYLFIISIYDGLIFGKEFCKHQAEWLTGIPCLTLGVISTLGSQISLFTMTVLSVIRMYGLTCKPMRVPGPVNKKSLLTVTCLGLVAMIPAFAIALTPLVPSLEDFFVQGMYYNSTYKVFIGFPNKERHFNIFRSYYEHNSHTSNIGTNISMNATTTMTWKEIGERVDDMFTQDFGTLTRSPVHFYGNDGVCLFKYFVRTNDARRSRQSTDRTGFTGDPVVWTMLAANLCCFLVITFCYIVITYKTRQSSQRSGQHDNEERQKNERAIQNKIMIIITTDFLCWVPFIIVSALHNLNSIDASNWYTSFAMTVLPLNSVINPLVYDKALGELIKRSFEGLKRFFSFVVLSGIAKIREFYGSLTTNQEQATEKEPEILRMDKIVIANDMKNDVQKDNIAQVEGNADNNCTSEV